MTGNAERDGGRQNCCVIKSLLRAAEKTHKQIIPTYYPLYIDLYCDFVRCKLDGCQEWDPN